MFLKVIFATQSFLNSLILILDMIRKSETDFQAWSEIVDLPQHFGPKEGLLKQICCHPMFLKWLISYSTHEKLFTLKFWEMVKSVVSPQHFPIFTGLVKKFVATAIP